MEEKLEGKNIFAKAKRRDRQIFFKYLCVNIKTIRWYRLCLIFTGPSFIEFNDERKFHQLRSVSSRALIFSNAPEKSKNFDQHYRQRKLNFQAFRSRHATTNWKRLTITVSSISWREHIESDSSLVNGRFSSRNARKEERKMFCFGIEISNWIFQEEKMNIERCTCVAFDLCCYGNDKDPFETRKNLKQFQSDVTRPNETELELRPAGRDLLRRPWWRWSEVTQLKKKFSSKSNEVPGNTKFRKQFFHLEKD